MIQYRSDMGETAISKAARAQIKRLFPQIRLTRLQAGIILKKGGGRVHCADAGWPDSAGYLPDGRFFAIEFKDKAGKVSELQQQRIDDINKCGGVAIVANGVYDCIIQIKEILNNAQ